MLWGFTSASSLGSDREGMMLYKHPWAHAECRASDTDMMEREKKEGEKGMSEQTEGFNMPSHLEGRLKAICL